ncbi:MAG TPA: hypothetical protein DEF02_04780 [Clostridiales bacterium]|nr:hypothetical protein [Clostridiales bacterium]
MSNKVKVTMDYNLKSHIIGKIWMALSLIIFFAVPTTICLYYDVKPDMTVMGKSAVLIPFIFNFFSGIFEPIIYSPMLGVNSAYLAFITGNLSNLKIPCVVKAQEICGTKLGTEENEVVSTLSVATSTLVTTVIIAIFVLILAVSNVETAIKNTPWITPAFTCVVYALFGSLGGKYVVKNIKLAVLPLVIIVAFSLILGFAAPSLGVGSAYLFVGIALCAIFGVLQVVREKKKAKLKEEQEHLEQIAVSDVELEQNGENDAQNGENVTADENADKQNAKSEKAEAESEENALEEAEKEAEQIAEDTQSVD